MMFTPDNVQIIGTEIAIRWNNGEESYIPCTRLRAASPSAEVRGEYDIFSQRYGGETMQNFSDVTVCFWEKVGNYALRFDFSDGHRTGLYSYDMLRELGQLSP